MQFPIHPPKPIQQLNFLLFSQRTGVISWRNVSIFEEYGGKCLQRDINSKCLECSPGFLPDSDCFQCLPKHGSPSCVPCPQCLNGGICSEGIDGTGSCECPDDYFGETCLIELGPNRLKNPEFLFSKGGGHWSLMGWNNYGGCCNRDISVKPGTIKCSNPGQACTLTQEVPLNQKEPLRVIVSASSKAQNVQGLEDEHYSVYVDVKYEDGTEQWGIFRSFDPGTHDYQRHRIELVPQKPIASVLVALRCHHPGNAFFSEVSVREVLSERRPGIEG